MSHRYNLRQRKTAGCSSPKGSKKAKIEKKEEKERTFQNFLEAPSDIRSIFIDKMNPDSRFLFAITSEQCRKEAVACKMFLTSIQFQPDTHDEKNQKNVTVFVSHQEQAHMTIDYSYHFDQMKKGVKLAWRTWTNSQNRECAHDNVLEAALAKTNEILVQHSHSLRVLGIHSTDAAKFNSDVMLPRLEILELYWVPKSELILRKINKPLKELQICIREFWENDNTMKYFDLMCFTQESVEIRGIKLTNEQFLQLQAKKIIIDIGYLNLQNIQEYIENWRKSDKGNEERTLRLFDNLVPQTSTVGTIGRRQDESDIWETVARSYGIDFVRGKEYVIKIKHSFLPVYAALTIRNVYYCLGFDVPYADERHYSKFERYEKISTEKTAVRNL